MQESGPERLDAKRALLARIDAAVPADVVIATSSSGLIVSDLQDACRHPERVVLGHPFNPPHLIPLVEVLGGRQTSPDAIEAAFAFYRRVEKRPIRLRREVPGHVANRLQAAIWREAFHLVEAGVATVADIDSAIAHGPGLRWALLGPFVNLHLSGGEGGIAHLLAHLGPSIEAWWSDLGSPEIGPELTQKIIEGLAEELGSSDRAALVAARDTLLLRLIAEKAGAEELP